MTSANHWYATILTCFLHNNMIESRWHKCTYLVFAWKCGAYYQTYVSFALLHRPCNCIYVVLAPDYLFIYRPIAFILIYVVYHDDYSALRFDTQKTCKCTYRVFALNPSIDCFLEVCGVPIFVRSSWQCVKLLLNKSTLNRNWSNICIVAVLLEFLFSSPLFHCKPTCLIAIPWPVTLDRPCIMSKLHIYRPRLQYANMPQ